VQIQVNIVCNIAKEDRPEFYCFKVNINDCVIDKLLPMILACNFSSGDSLYFGGKLIGPSDTFESTKIINDSKILVAGGIGKYEILEWKRS